MPVTKKASTPRQLEFEIGSRLARLRLSHNVTQSMLAKDAGIGLRTLRRLETGESSSFDTFPARRPGSGPGRCRPGRNTRESNSPDRARLADPFRTSARTSATTGGPRSDLDVG